MTRTRIGIILPVLLLAACLEPLRVAQQGRSTEPGGARTGGGSIGRDRELTLPISRKVVSGKESPSTLVSSDGYRCTVTKKRFDETHEGDSATCAWRN